MNIPKAITPKEVLEQKTLNFNSSMIKAINTLLVQKLDNSPVILFTQDELIEEFFKLEPEYNRDQIFYENLFAFHKIYENAGWTVEYESPSYRDDFEPFYTFRFS